MISRVAEHCFWMGRYLERAEDTARILDVNQTLLLDYHVPLELQWRPVLIISGVTDMPGEPEAESNEIEEVNGHAGNNGPVTGGPSKRAANRTRKPTAERPRGRLPKSKNGPTEV